MTAGIAIIVCGFLIYSLVTLLLIKQVIRVRGDKAGGISPVLLGGFSPTVFIYLASSLSALITQGENITGAFVAITSITFIIFVIGFISVLLLSIFTKRLKWGIAFLIGFSVSIVYWALFGYVVATFD